MSDMSRRAAIGGLLAGAAASLIPGERTNSFSTHVPVKPAPVLTCETPDSHHVKVVLVDGVEHDGVVAACPRLGWIERYIASSHSLETEIVTGRVVIEWHADVPQVVRDYWSA